MTPVSEPIEVQVESVAAGGAGVARLPDGRVCFIHRTAPGDRVRIRLTNERRRWARGELLEVVESGPARRPAPCPFYGRCGGCTIQHLDYRTQLDAKARIVADALERIGGVDAPEVGAIRASPSEYGYRSRISFHLRRLRDDRVVAGFHQLERPGHIVDIDGRCLLPEAGLVRCWDDLRTAWGPGARHLPPGPALRLTLRKVVGGVVLTVEPEGEKPDAEEQSGPPPPRARGGPPQGARALVEAIDELRAVWWRSFGGRPRLLAGDPDTRERWAGREVRTGSGAFLQVNRSAAKLLHEAVLETVGDPTGLRVVDAYCGVGSWGRELARRGATAVGIELDPEAVTAAGAEAPAGFTVLEGAVEARLIDALPAELVLLNPPRSGLDAAVPARLRASGVGRLVYVSCDPATLARDVGRLDGTYRVVELRAFDLFPQTTHVEVLAVLDREPD